MQKIKNLDYRRILVKLKVKLNILCTLKKSLSTTNVIISDHMLSVYIVICQVMCYPNLFVAAGTVWACL